MLIRTWIRTAVAPTAIQDSAASQVPTIPTVAQVLTSSPVPSRAPTAAQVPTAQEDLDNDSEMWNMYMDEVKEEDSRTTDAWKEDAGSIVVFVSLDLLIPVFVSMTSSKDRSFLRNRWRLHHRILQEVVHRFWQSDSGPSSADFTATSQLPK
jgi:hypothetical protein